MDPSGGYPNLGEGEYSKRPIPNFDILRQCRQHEISIFTMTNSNFPDPFELKVLQLALRGDKEWQAVLRQQLPFLTVAKRTVTGVGFYTDFTCSEQAPAVSFSPVVNLETPYSDYPPTVNAIRSLPCEGLATFIVWIGANGRISQLEACSMTDDKWPNNIFEGFHDFQDDMGNVIAP